MKKFLKLTSISMQSQMYYRTSFFLNLISPIIQLIGQFLLWIALYKQQAGAIGEFGYEAMLTYMLFAFALNQLFNWSTENMISKEIRTGMVVTRCIRPVSYLEQNIAQILGNVIIQFVVNSFIVIAAYVVFGKHLLQPELKNMVLFFFSFVLALILRIMFTDICSLLCFFCTGHLGITWTRIALFEFFSGALIPVSLFPHLLKIVSYATPFPYIIQIPIALLLGQPTLVPLVTCFIVQTCWIFCLLFLHCVIYGRVRSNMTIAGG